MAPVLHLDPAVEPAAAVRALAVLRDQPLQPHQAGVAKQVRPDLALLERRQVDAVNAAGLAAVEAPDRRIIPNVGARSKARHSKPSMPKIGGPADPYRYFIHPLIIETMPEADALRQALEVDPGGEKAADQGLAKMIRAAARD